MLNLYEIKKEAIWNVFIKLWIDQGREFYNKFLREWLDNNDILMYSTHDDG